MTFARALIFGAAGVLFLLSVHVSDLSSREAALARFFANENEGIGRIIDDYGVKADDCSEGHGDDFHALAMALVTVESFATSRAEGLVRATIAYGGALTGLGTDISAGPGRIRMSTARAVLAGTSGDRRTISDRTLIGDLLTKCGATRTATQFLRRAEDDPFIAHVDLKFVRAAAAAYNGQTSRASSSQAVLSARVYFELVYAAFQHYRFAAL